MRVSTSLSLLLDSRSLDELSYSELSLILKTIFTDNFRFSIMITDYIELFDLCVGPISMASLFTFTCELILIGYISSAVYMKLRNAEKRWVSA